MMNKRNLYFDYFVLPPSNFVDPVNGNFPSISSLMDSGRCAQYLPPHIFSYFHIFYSYFHIFISCCTPRKDIFIRKRNSPSFEKMLLLQVSRRVVETSHVVKFFAVSAPFLHFPPAFMLRFLIFPTFIFPVVLRFLIFPTFIFPVLGAGDTAFDCATSALRCGAKRVFVIFRKVVQFKESFSPSQVIFL